MTAQDTLIRFSDLGGLTPSWVKPAEDGNGLVIRLHECSGEGGTATLALRRELFDGIRPDVTLTNILEDETLKTRIHDAGEHDGYFLFGIPYDAYRIVTVRVSGENAGLRA